MTILSLGVIRGVIGQIIFAVIGIVIAAAARMAMGQNPLWNTRPEDGAAVLSEGVLVLGAVLSVLGFMLGVGALDDWLQWMGGKKTPMRHGPPPGKPEWTRYFGVDYNHKVIGVQYGVTGIALLLVGGSLAWLFRFELTEPGIQVVTDALGGPHTFNTWVSAHGIIMIGSILLGVGGLMNYLVPLMIGASDMAFPRLNAFGYWINVPGAVLIVVATLAGGWNTGWTGYPPLAANMGPTGAPFTINFFFLGVYMIGLSSIVGGANLLVTVASMRAPGMTLFRMPIFVWASVATSLIQLTATQLIGLSFLMVLVQRVLSLGFFDPNLTEHAHELGSPPGNVILFQHLFWFYSHPAVYVFILPGLGIISELLPVFCRKPLFGYKWIAMSSLAIALVGFIVWAHHMFVAGMEDFLRLPFMYATLLVAVPTGVKFFSWLGTMWRGKMVFPTPMLFVLGAISVFLIGGLSGPPNGTVTTDMHLHDTYWIVGHFHGTMFGGFVFPFFAAVYYWFPKITGRMFNESLGKLHFWIMTPAFWLQSLSQMQVGLLGMRRRVVDYDVALDITTGHVLTTVAAIAIGVSVLIMVVNLIMSVRSKEVAVANPWGSRSPEFQIPSPIPEHSYAHPFLVIGEPYDFGRGEYLNMSPGGGHGMAGAPASK